MRTEAPLMPGCAPGAQISALDEARASAVRAYLRWRGKLPLTLEAYRFWNAERGLTRSILERTISMMADRGEVVITESGGYVTVRLADGRAQ